jgi:cellulose synthase/poly-beta-1,6-N-acetylglucosamine synthase-like glycosyltransferase
MEDMDASMVIIVISSFLLVYPYVFYPYIVRLLVKKENDVCPVDPADWPMLTVIISFHNANEAVVKKVANLLEIDYPSHKLEVLFVSDGKNDKAVSYLRDLGISAIKVIDIGERVGKTEAENRARPYVSGEIVVFTDCSTSLELSVFKNLVRNFTDPRVGTVSTTDKIVGADASLVGHGENVYVEKEMLLRKWESRAGMLIGLSGSCYACRRELYEILPPETTRDLSIALLSLKKGYINVSADNAICALKTQQSMRAEFRRKVRTINNGMATILDHTELFNFFKYGRITFAVISHKLLRWLSFPLQAIICIATALAVRHYIYPLITHHRWIWCAVIAGACLLWICGKSPLFKLCINYFVASFAAFVAGIEIMGGKRYVWWNPTNR